MFEQAAKHYATILQEIRDAGLWKHERIIASPQGAAHPRSAAREVAELLREQLPRPVEPPAGHRGGARRARRARLRAVERALHLRHAGPATRSSRRRSRRSSAPRTRSSTRRASTRTAGCSRRCSARRTRSSPTRSTTRRSSTASGCARPSATATSTTTSTSSRTTLEATPGKRAADDRDRRRVLDGRRHRAARRDLRPRRAATARW